MNCAARPEAAGDYHRLPHPDLFRSTGSERVPKAAAAGAEHLAFSATSTLCPEGSKSLCLKTLSIRKVRVCYQTNDRAREERKPLRQWGK